MKFIPPPEIQGRTPAERFDNALRTILKVSKESVLKAEAQEKRKPERKKEQKQK